MLGGIIADLNENYKIVLASGSPSRYQILTEKIGLKFTVRPTDFPEDLDKANFSGPEEYVKVNAQSKMNEALKDPQNADADLIICCDSILAFDGTVYEKPANDDIALQRLKLLRGNTHQFMSTVVLCLKKKDGERIMRDFTNITQIAMADSTDEMLEAYIKLGEYKGTAAGYRIDAVGGSLVSKVDGCFYNCCGFPQHQFCETLLEMLSN